MIPIFADLLSLLYPLHCTYNPDFVNDPRIGLCSYPPPSNLDDVADMMVDVNGFLNEKVLLTPPLVPKFIINPLENFIYPGLVKLTSDTLPYDSNAFIRLSWLFKDILIDLHLLVKKIT